jgi:Type IV secretion system pilin
MHALTKKTIGSLYGFLLALFVMAVPFLAGAQRVGADTGLTNYLKSILEFFQSVILPFLLGVGFIFVVWGVFLYFIKGAADDDAKEQGKNTIIYALAGFVIIFVFLGVVNLLAKATGLSGNTLENSLLPTKLPGPK